MDAEVEREDENSSLRKDHEWRSEFQYTSRPRSSLTIVILTYLISGYDFWGSQDVQRAAVRRGYLVMKSRFPNFGDSVHHLSVRERIVATIKKSIPTPNLGRPSSVWSPFLNDAISPPVRERIDRERAAGW